MSLDFAYFAEQCREHAEKEEWTDLCSTIGTSGDYLHYLLYRMNTNMILSLLA